MTGGGGLAASAESPTEDHVFYTTITSYTGVNTIWVYVDEGADNVSRGVNAPAEDATEYY